MTPREDDCVAQPFIDPTTTQMMARTRAAATEHSHLLKTSCSVICACSPCIHPYSIHTNRRQRGRGEGGDTVDVHGSTCLIYPCCGPRHKQTDFRKIFTKHVYELHFGQAKINCYFRFLHQCHFRFPHEGLAQTKSAS